MVRRGVYRIGQRIMEIELWRRACEGGRQLMRGASLLLMHGFAKAGGRSRRRRNDRLNAEGQRPCSKRQCYVLLPASHDFTASHFLGEELKISTFRV